MNQKKTIRIISMTMAFVIVFLVTNMLLTFNVYANDENQTETRIAYQLDDIELLARMMYAEVGVFFWNYEEDPEEVELIHKLAGSVVINRLRNEVMGATCLADVLYSEGQYAQQTIQKVESGEQDIPEEVYIWSEELLTEGTIGPSNLVYQAQFPQGQLYRNIGNQYFGVEPSFKLLTKEINKG